MSKNNGGRRRNRRKNKNDGQSKDDESRDELYDDFLSMFGESVDPIEIFNVLKRNEWKPESAVDELMKLSQQCDSVKSSSKFDASLYDEDLNYQAMASKPQQSSQNYYNFSPHSTKTEKSNVKQFNGFHDVKVVYKGENSEDEADADIIIEEEDVYNEQGLKVLQESTAPFETNILLNAIASHSPASIPNRVKNNPKTLNSDFEKLNVDNVAFQKNVIAQRYAPSAPTLNMTETNVGLPETTSIHVIYQECLEIVDTVDRVCSLVLNSIKVMILLRGCPGSGKSFVAEKMIMNVNKIRPHMNLKLKDHVFSTDDYFMSPKHGYRFDAKMLPQAHDWNKNRAHKALLKNVNPVIIDNTNTQIWEMAPYVQLGVQYGYVVEVAEPETKWKFNEYELFRRNIHGVPRANIRNMLERYEHGITKNNILQMLKCQYHPSNHPPQIDAAGGMNVSRNTPKDNTAPFKGNGWPANFAQPSTDLPPCSFPSYEQKGDNNQNSRLLKNDLSTCSFPSYEQTGNYNQNSRLLKNDSSSKEDKYSNLTASCRSFFENSLLSSASGSDGFKVASNEASGAKMNREQNDRSRASSRNALLSSMLKDCTMPDVVAKSPSIPQGWLTFNNQLMPKPLIGDAKVTNIEEKRSILIDFGSRENMDAPSESDTIKDELVEVTGMMSKVDITKQHQSISVCSSDVSEKLDTDLYENMDLKGSLNSEKNNPLLETLLNVTELEYPKIETGNLTEKIKTECLMDEDDPASTIQNNDLMPCLSVNKIPSNINGNVVITQISNNSTSHSKDTDSVHEIKLSFVKEESVDNISVTNHEENCQESTQSPKAVRVTNEMKEENGNYLNVLKEESQVLHSTPNEVSDSSSGRKDSCMRNDEENTEKTNQELPSGIVEINEACGIVSNAKIEKEQSSNSVSNPEVENPNIDIKDVKLAPTKQDDQQSYNSVSNPEVETPKIEIKDVKLAPAKQDDQQSYNSVSNPEVETPKIEIKDVKLAHTKQDNEKLTNSVSNEEVKPPKIDFKDFRFTSTKLDNQNASSSVSNEEAGSLKTDIKEFKFTSTKPDNKTSSGSNNKDLFFSELKDDPVDDYFNNAEISALLESLEELDLQFVTDEETEVSKQTNVDEPVIIETVTNGSPDEHLTVTANGTIDSNSDSINICKETGSLEQPDSAEPLKHSDESDQLNSISPITSPSEAKLASPQSPSDESDGLNTSSSTRILTDSFMTVAEDDNNSDSVYFDVDAEANESIKGDSSEPNYDRVTNENEESNASDAVVISEENDHERSVDTVSQTTVEDNRETASENNEGESFVEGELLLDSNEKERIVGELDNVEDNPPQTSVNLEETVDENVEQLSNNKKEKEVVDSVLSQSSVAEEPVAQKQSSLSIDGVKALIKGGVPVKTFDVMSWLKNSFIKESSEESSSAQHLMSDSAENVIENNELILVDESGNLNSQFSDPVSDENVEQQTDNSPKPSRDIERTVPPQQNYSIIGSNQSNTEGSRKRNTFLNWDSVDEPENSWAKKMKNTLGASDEAEDSIIPKSQREKNSQHGSSGLEVENVHESAATKVIDILSTNIEEPVDQKQIETLDEKESFGQKLLVLAKLFPETQSIYVEEILRQCQGDVNWAAGLLLEGGCEVSAEAYCSTKNAARGLVEIRKSTGDEPNQASCSKSSLKKQKKEKKNANNSMSEARMELKKMMEQNFVLSENSYSDHLLKLLKFRRGEVDPVDQTGAEMIGGYDPELYSGVDGIPGEQFEGVDNYAEGGEHFEKTEFPNQEPLTAETNLEDEEMLEFVFNKDVITTLSYNFGSSGFPLDMADVCCPVKLPMRLARELHSYWMDSVEEYLSQENMRMQMMIKEDEELAKRLQQEEACAVDPNLQEVIDYETALMLHEANLKKTREAQGTDSTVAAKLSLSILTEKYPKEKEEFLSQLLSSNNNSLHNTLALLKITRDQQQTQEQQVADNVKHEFDDCDESSIFEESETLQSSYERSRDEAKMHFIKRNEYFQKAQQEYTSGSKAAASFFSQLANMHMKKMEEANCKAATLLLCTSRSTKNTLDLHFYQVKEAVQVLDLFIDASMTRLEESRKPRMKIFIITGRGLHSVNGKSVIKPIVMRRLQQRKIRFHEDETNPGAIICTLTRYL